MKKLFEEWRKFKIVAEAGPGGPDLGWQDLVLEPESFDEIPPSIKRGGRVEGPSKAERVAAAAEKTATKARVAPELYSDVATDPGEDPGPKRQRRRSPLATAGELASGLDASDKIGLEKLRSAIADLPTTGARAVNPFTDKNIHKDIARGQFNFYEQGDILIKDDTGKYYLYKSGGAMATQNMYGPFLDVEMKDPHAIRNLIDARNELLWSGGAVGLSRVWPHMKKFFGKNIFGVEKGMKVSGGIDAAGNPVMVDVMDQAKKLDVPMNVFSTSKAGFVNAAGKVIGLFPFVATRARQAQNAQQIAVATQINNVLNDLSPVSLFADSGVLAMKEFKNMVSSFAASKAVLYKRAHNLADKVGDEFIPLERLKNEARALEYATYGPKGKQAGAGSLGVNVPNE